MVLSITALMSLLTPPMTTGLRPLSGASAGPAAVATERRTVRRAAWKSVFGEMAVILVTWPFALAGQTPLAARAEARFGLRHLWTYGQLTHPTVAWFASAGLYVFDHGEQRVVVMEPRTGKVRRTVGRRGAGPGEFNGPVQPLGQAADPMVIQFSSARLTAVGRGERGEALRVAAGQWSSGCSTDGERLYLQRLGMGAVDVFVSTLGAGAAVVDSMPYPWPEVRAQPPLVRQGFLRQLNDTSCALVLLYQAKVAMFTAGGRVVTGTLVDPPGALREEVKESGKTISRSLPTGSRPRALDVAAWRGDLLVLAYGSHDRTVRFLDRYDAALRYVDTVRLPLAASSLAVRGDTLVLVGETDDAVVVSAFLLRRARAPGANE